MKQVEQAAHPYPQLSQSKSLRILHWRCTLIPSKLRSRPQLHLLLLLDQCTASTPEGDTAVSRTGSLNAMLLAHFTPPIRLNDPLAVSEGENGENGALQAMVSLVRLVSSDDTYLRVDTTIVL